MAFNTDGQDLADGPNLKVFKEDLQNIDHVRPI